MRISVRVIAKNGDGDASDSRQRLAGRFTGSIYAELIRGTGAGVGKGGRRSSPRAFHAGRSFPRNHIYSINTNYNRTFIRNERVRGIRRRDRVIVGWGGGEGARGRGLIIADN